MKEGQLVNIDFSKCRETFREFVHNKAKLAGSTIVYVSKGQLIEEDPKNNKTIVLKETFAVK